MANCNKKPEGIPLNHQENPIKSPFSHHFPTIFNSYVTVITRFFMIIQKTWDDLDDFLPFAAQTDDLVGCRKRWKPTDAVMKNGESHVVFLRGQDSPVMNWEDDGIYTRVEKMNRKWLQWRKKPCEEKQPQTVIVVDTVSARLLEKSMLIMQQDKNHLQNGNTVW